MNAHPGALHLVASRVADRIRPPAPVPFSRWLTENLELVDGPQAGEVWSAAGAPYLVEIADCLSDDHPCNLVTIRKSQQSGASILALGWCLYIADREPANTLYAAPNIAALHKLNSGKLQPLIDAWHARIKPRKVFAEQISRSGIGSTINTKVFPGGRLWLANANSVTDLSSVTAKKGVKDEVSKWEALENDADPENLFFGRFTAFRRVKDFKILEISTPEVDVGEDSEDVEGHCRIDRSFKRSDMRFWNCICPECGRYFVHHFDRFKIDAQHPHRSVYPCFCGHDITETERVIAVRAGKWIASIDNEPERHPGFHIDAFISLMMDYGAIAEDWVKSQKNETAKKDFSNLVLGLPYHFRGDAPDHEKLLARREDYKRGHIPPGALLLTIGADVQMRGIYYEVLAHAPDRSTWVIEADYLDGDTAEIDGGAFAELSKIFDRRWPDAFGNTWRHDEFGIDSGYRSNQVYAWTKRHAGSKALKGQDGWGHPALGTAKPQDVDYRGVRIRNGAALRGVGTWPLKATFYSYLGIAPETRNGVPHYPAGYCHFGKFLDEIYFKQITSEHLVKAKRNNREIQRWDEHGKAGNHFLDCRIYNMAISDAYHASFTTDEWIALAKRRGIAADLQQPDLFTPAEFRSSENIAGAALSDGAASDGLYGDSLAALNKGTW